MQIIVDKITIDELKKMSDKMYNRLVKAVVDIEKKYMIIDMEMHADGEMILLEEGSQQKNLWGINIHPEREKNEMIEFDSIINIRPSQNNRSRGVEDESIQQEIKNIVHNLVVIS